jgi:hypothetical protein
LEEGILMPMNPQYAHLPPPPVPFTHVFSRPPVWPSQNFPDQAEKHPVYAWHVLDAGGHENVEMVSLTDYLWRAIQQHCLHACHTLHLSLRGAWKSRGTVSGSDFNQAVVELGDHSARQIIVQHAEWPAFVEELAVKLMPGWWNPPHTPLIGRGCGLPDNWLHIEREICALRPGGILRVPDIALELPKGGENIWEAITDRTPLDAILEQITGAAYELTLIRQERGFLSKPEWIVRRLKQPLTNNNIRAFISPDRRAGWTQDKETGLWHRDQQI